MAKQRPQSKESKVYESSPDPRHDSFMTPKERDEAAESDKKRRMGQHGELPWQKKMHEDWARWKKK